jgi:hypothetical protein
MPRLARLIFAFVLVLLAPLAVRADAGRYPIKTDEGDVVANFDLNPSLSTTCTATSRSGNSTTSIAPIAARPRPMSTR